MARKRICTKCGHENDAKASECENCAVLFRDVSQDERKTKFSGHDSNPSDPVCISCGGVASTYPGALRGGGKGYCSECFRRIGRGAFMGKTEDGSQTIKDIREMLNQPLEAYVRKRMRSA